jgi:predicted metal-binding protein
MQSTPVHDTAIQSAIDHGATHAADLDISAIKFYPQVRRMCECNSCGSIGKNWQCPPHVGTLKENAAVTRSYQHGILVQSVGELEDSYDIEGMGRLQTEHQKRLRGIAGDLRDESGVSRVFALGAGPCDVCSRCTILDDKPCHLPDKIMPSVEAYGMNAQKIVESCGMSYINGRDTVSYVGVVLFDLDDVAS